MRVYDEATKTLTSELRSGSGYGANATSGHSNRIFSCKWVPGDDNVLLSGGWDNTVQVWDLRAGRSVRSLFGPHLCGDALDVDGNGNILTGSWRPTAPLELWDMGTGELIEAVDWSSSVLQSQPCLLYAAQFSALGGGSRFIAAGGSGANEARVFDRHADNALVGTVAGLARGVFTVSFAPPQPDAPDAPPRLAVAGGDASIRIIDVVDKVSPGAVEPAEAEGASEPEATATLA